MKSTMSNKKKGILITAILLIAAVAIGMTMAYFTDTATKTNQITMGKVDIDLTETSKSSSNPLVIQGKSSSDGGFTYDDVKPGNIISKIPVVTLKEGPAYTRVNATYTLTAPKASADEAELVAGYLTDTVNSIQLGSGWTVDPSTITATPGANNTFVVTATYYYATELTQAGDATTALFEEIKIPTSWGNEMSEAGLTIKLDAQGIQTTGITVGDATHVGYGWFDTTGVAISATDPQIKAAR